MRPLAEVDVADLQHVWRTNIGGPLVLTSALLPWLKAANGVLLSISSDAAVNHYETWGLYGASKAALDHVTLTYAVETGLTGYAVDPGDMRTAMHQDAFPGEDISDRPLPESVVPRLLALLEPAPGRVATGRRTSDDAARRVSAHPLHCVGPSRRSRPRRAAWSVTRCACWSRPRTGCRTGSSVTSLSTCTPATSWWSTPPPR